MEAWTKCGLIPFDGTAATGGISSAGSGTNARWFGLESGVGALGRGIGMGADCGHPVRALTLIASSSWSLPVLLMPPVAAVPSNGIRPHLVHASISGKCYMFNKHPWCLMKIVVMIVSFN